MASVRFICGTQTVHRELERRLSAFLGTEDAILYSSCFDANGGLFETLLGEEDAVISDALNHASIIDGIRLCKAKRLRYGNNDMADLEARLREAEGARSRLIATDGVFSMDGMHRRPARHLRPRRPLRRAGHGGRLACRRLHRRARPRHARALRRRGARRHPDRHPRQGARRRLRRLRVRARGRSSPGCGSARAPTSSRTRWRRSSRRRRSRCSSCSSRGRAPRERLAANAACFRGAAGGRGLRAGARRASDHPGDARRRRARDAHGGPPARGGRLRDRLLLSRWCRRARRASARRCAPRTRAEQIDTAVAAFAKVGRELGVIGK